MPRKAFRPTCSRSEGVPQPLRPVLANVELRTDRTYRRHAIHSQLIREHLSRPLLKRIQGFGSVSCAVLHRMRTADHHHELVRTSQREGRPRSHRRSYRPAPEAMGHVGRERRRDAQAEQPARQHGNRRPTARRVQRHHRARVDQPSTVSGTICRVQPTSPCAGTKA
jgi:hypothetical protein